MLCLKHFITLMNEEPTIPRKRPFFQAVASVIFTLCQFSALFKSIYNSEEATSSCPIISSMYRK